MATIVPMTQGGNTASRTGTAAGSALSGFFEAEAQKKKLAQFQTAVTEAASAPDRKTASGLLMPFAEDIEDISKINEQLDSLFPSAEFEMVEGFNSETGAKTSVRTPVGESPTDPNFTFTSPVGTAQEFVRADTGKSVGSFFLNSPKLKTLQSEGNLITRGNFDRQAKERGGAGTAGGKTTLTDLKVQVIAQMTANEQKGLPRTDGLTTSQLDLVQSDLNDPARIEAMKIAGQSREFFKLKTSDEQTEFIDNLVQTIRGNKDTAALDADAGVPTPPADLPPAGAHSNKVLEDPDTGLQWISNGTTWILAQ